MTAEFEVARLRLMPGDVVVIRTEDHLSLGQREQLAVIFKGHKVLCLLREDSVSVVSPSKD